MINRFVLFLCGLTLTWSNFLVAVAERRNLLELEERNQERARMTKDQMLTLASIVLEKQ